MVARTDAIKTLQLLNSFFGATHLLEHVTVDFCSLLEGLAGRAKLGSLDLLHQVLV